MTWERWIQKTGLDQYPPGPEHILDEIRNLERALERRRARVKHGPTARDREKAAARADQIEDRLIAATQRLAQEFPGFPYPRL